MTLALHYDPLDATTLSDPYPIYARIRESSPVFWHEHMQSWVLTRYQDCVDVLRNHEVFARDWRRVGESVPEPSLSVQSVDPPDQAPLRSLFMNSLRAQDLEAIGRRARTRVTELFAGLAGQGEFDFVHRVAAPLSLYVISELLGVEQPELESFVTVSDTIMRSMDVGLTPEIAEAGQQARRELSRLVESWFEAAERPGLLADVRRARADVDVPDHYVRNTTRVMFQGGYSTMVAATGNLALTLLRRPDALERLRDTGLVETGVDELIRFDGPVQGTSRVAAEATTIGDTEIARGEIVLTLFAAANHDPDQFPTPEQLVLDRSPNQHLGFGWGPHSCIGTVIAQIGLRELVNAMLEWPSELTLVREPQRRRTATMRCVESLPVKFAR